MNSASGHSPCSPLKSTARKSGSKSVSKELDERIRRAVEAINSIHEEIDSQRDERDEEMYEVSQKYWKLAKPFYDKRNTATAKIPNFWVMAMANHPELHHLILEEEKDCLHFLKKMEVEYLDGCKRGHQLKLFFRKNRFFENRILIKEISSSCSSGKSKSTSTEIQWNENMDLSKRVQEVNAMKRKWGLETNNGFFAWFADNGDPRGDRIAVAIKNDFFRHSLFYFKPKTWMQEPMGRRRAG